MLTRTFLKNLTTKAHQMSPIILIGNKGLTPQVHKEVEIALLAHELIKIRVNAASPELRKEMISELVKKHKSTKVQGIGHVLVLYRANPEKKQLEKKQPAKKRAARK